MYKKRIADSLLKTKLEVFGGVLITGPKGCGKTTTAKQVANSFVELQDEDKKYEYLKIIDSMPSKILEGEKPRLFDEWQDAPKLWGAIRKSIDDSQTTGLYILTGSTSKTVKTSHTGTLRISELRMRPMSLYESEESNGEISLLDLVSGKISNAECHSKLNINDIIYAICRGGWPQAVNIKEKELSLMIARDLYRQTCAFDASSIDGRNRNASWIGAILKSYSRNICTVASLKTMIDDVKINTGFSDVTYYDYLSALEHLFIIDEINAWCPNIRSKTAIRTSKKRNLIDPSIAVASLNLNPDHFNNDFKTLGFLFESLCIRDLKIYAELANGEISYYRDRYGLEADAVLHLPNGKYALIEIKLGEKEIENGAKHLRKIEDLIKEQNEINDTKINLPNAKIILTGTEYGYKRSDGVYVIPIGCLKP